MQFYIHLWTETGYTISQLGEWETRDPFEYEAFMKGYRRRLELQDNARKRAKQKATRRRV